MKSWRNLMIVLVTVVLAASLAGPAAATCVASGRVTFSEHNDLNSIFYMASDDLPSCHIYFATDNPIFILLLSSFQANMRVIRIQGDAVACPGTGFKRNGGRILNVWIQ